MADCGERLAGEEARQSDVVFEAELDEAIAGPDRARDEGPVGRAGRVDPRLGQASVLEADVIIIVQVVEADHLVPPLEEAPDDMEADEPGRARDQDLHRPTPA